MKAYQKFREAHSRFNIYKGAVPKFCCTDIGSSQTLALAATPEACSVATAASQTGAKSPKVEREARRTCLRRGYRGADPG